MTKAIAGTVQHFSLTEFHSNKPLLAWRNPARI